MNASQPFTFFRATPVSTCQKFSSPAASTLFLREADALQFGAGQRIQRRCSSEAVPIPFPKTQFGLVNASSRL